jgi:hypothetical protein
MRQVLEFLGVGFADWRGWLDCRAVKERVTMHHILGYVISFLAGGTVVGVGAYKYGQYVEQKAQAVLSVLKK